MPSKKRAVPPATLTGDAKRRKTPKSYTSTAAVDLTTQNATQSPLLRLPAELRDAIWKIAFGDQMIHVHCTRDPENRDQNLVKFTPCHAVGNSAMPLPQFVCRQFWAETSQVFLSSCIFRVNHPYGFRALALSGAPVVPRIRRLMVHLGSSSHNFPMYWHNVLTSSLVGRFVSLEGLNFTGCVYWGPQEEPRDTGVMNGYHWRMIKLPAVVRSFQQHRLKEELTSVTFEPELWAHEPIWSTKRINEAIREQLLQHHPRRLSKRRS